MSFTVTEKLIYLHSSNNTQINSTDGRQNKQRKQSNQPKRENSDYIYIVFYPIKCKSI